MTKECECGCGQPIPEHSRDYVRYIKNHHQKCIRLTEKRKKEMGERKKGNKNFLGKKHSEETKKKMSEAAVGRVISEEQKKSISEHHMGSKSPWFTNGSATLAAVHRTYRKDHCEICNKDCSPKLAVFHEPTMDYKNAIGWEGRLITLCYRHMTMVTHNNFPIPEKAGTIWTKEDTKKVQEEHQ
jgi:hypothetical protein